MKRTVLLLLIALSLSAVAVAQVPNIDFGIKAGANLAKLDGKSWDNGYKASYLGGLFGGMRASKFGVQIEAFFSQSKYTTTGKEFYNVYKGAPGVVFNPIIDSAKQHNFNVGYLNIPVLLQFKLFQMLWIQLGPQYSGIVSIKDKDNLVGDAKGLFKSGDISGVVGLELKLPVHLTVGGRYVLGFSSMNKNDIGGAWQQRTIQLHVGYSFL